VLRSQRSHKREACRSRCNIAAAAAPGYASEQPPGATTFSCPAPRGGGTTMNGRPWRCCGWAVLGAALFLPAGRGTAGGDKTAVVPLTQAHAHNDYEHKRPLFDALDNGFCSVEADIFLVDGALLVGHTRADLKPERTLEKLYLDPLRERIKANAGKVYAGGPTVFLLIDVKTEAKSTYAALRTVLAKYADILSVAKGDKFQPGAITVVVSGNCDRDGITAEEVRYAGIDGRPPDLDSTAASHLIPWVSQRWGALFQWKGDGPMPEAELTKLREYVARAHKHGRLVRFWATPENPVFWEQLLAAGVDLINTDQLPELREFLLARKK
jgi:hypothetical protein